jgi:hypothetical protein
MRMSSLVLVSPFKSVGRAGRARLIDLEASIGW